MPHGLHHKNFLVDAEYNITGLVDWSDAQTAPLECCVVSPEFNIFPGLSEEGNASIKGFVALFVKALKEIEEKNAREDLTTTPLSEIVGTTRAEYVDSEGFLPSLRPFLDDSTCF